MNLQIFFVPRRNEFRKGDIEIPVSVRASVSACVRHNFVHATPLRPLNGFRSNFVGLLGTISSWSYYTAILIWQILRELWDFVDFFCTFATVDFVHATPPRPLNGFHSNFVGLLVTICTWSYYTAILIRQILLRVMGLCWFFLTCYTIGTLCARNSSDTAQRISFKICGIVSHHICSWSYYTAILIRLI